jgi:asparagine synthase (glutamine-hydrolysing)
MKHNGADVRTFSVTFDEEAFDESRYSHWVATRLETRHTEIRLRRDAFYEMVPRALAAMDQPTFDGLNTYCVSHAARESGLKVALSGLGADELFGGSPESHRWRVSCRNLLQPR